MGEARWVNGVRRERSGQALIAPWKRRRSEERSVLVVVWCGGGGYGAIVLGRWSSAGNFIVSAQNLWATIYNVLSVYVLLQFILPRINT